MHNDSILEVSENTLILKPLMASIYLGITVSKIPRFGFLVTETKLLVSVTQIGNDENNLIDTNQ